MASMTRRRGLSGKRLIMKDTTVPTTTLMMSSMKMGSIGS